MAALFIDVEFGLLIGRGDQTVIDRLLFSERAKVIAVIAVVAVGTGLTAKSVISFPTECTGEQQAQIWIQERIATL